MSTGRALAIAMLVGLAAWACAAPAPLPPPAPEGPPTPVSTPMPSDAPAAVAAAAASGACVDPPDEKPPRRDDGDTMSVPTKPVKIGRVTCKAGREVWLDPEKRLHVCTVDRPVTVEGVPIAADAYTWFHKNGRPWQTTIQRAASFKTGDGKEIPCAAEHLVMSEEGALESCTLGKAISIGDVACKAGESVAFRPGGQLWAAVMDKPYSALGVTFPAGTGISFHASGKIAGAYVREPMTIAGYPAQYQVDVYESGRLAKLTLAEPLEISGHPFPQWAKLWLREDGSLFRAEYVAKRGFMVHGEPWTDTRHMRFDCGGGIVSDHETHYQADRPPPRRPWKR
jgi:hypothetical protein